MSRVSVPGCRDGCNEGPLKRAQENILQNGLEEKIETRLSDGFKALAPGEADTAVIAGMGGGLTIRILKNGMEVVRSLKECILQPQSEIDKVSTFLLGEGFSFIKEDMVEEDGKYYPMMYGPRNLRRARPVQKSGRRRNFFTAAFC